MVTCSHDADALAFTSRPLSCVQLRKKSCVTDLLARQISSLRYSAFGARFDRRGRVEASAADVPRRVRDLMWGWRARASRRWVGGVTPHPRRRVLREKGRIRGVVAVILSYFQRRRDLSSEDGLDQ
jgi:hypothetical protein